MSEDRKISERYRELSREEPPRHVDQAILAAARRAADTRPAPLVVPSGRQRWYFPVAAAAIIVLAVAVTMHVEREQPDPEAPAVSSATAPEPPKDESAKPQVFAPDPKPAAPRKEQAAGARDSAAPEDLQKAQTPPPPQDAIGRASEPARADAEARAAQPRSEAAGAARSRQAEAPSPPEQVLQGIADLRRQGRHDEADKALAEFRKRYPDYKISREMLEKVERR